MGNDIESLSHTKWRCQYHKVMKPLKRVFILLLNLIVVIFCGEVVYIIGCFKY